MICCSMFLIACQDQELWMESSTAVRLWISKHAWYKLWISTSPRAFSMIFWTCHGLAAWSIPVLKYIRLPSCPVRQFSAKAPQATSESPKVPSAANHLRKMCCFLSPLALSRGFSLSLLWKVCSKPSSHAGYDSVDSQSRGQDLKLIW